MFYCDPERAYRIRSAYHTARCGVLQHHQKARSIVSFGYRITGESSFLVGGKTIHAPAESVIYIPEGTAYIRSSTDENMLIIHLQCFGNTGDELTVFEGMSAAEPLFRKIVSAWNADPVTHYSLAMQCLYAIFGLLNSAQKRHSPPVPSVIQPGIALLSRRFTDPGLSVKDLAAACCISEVYFRRLYGLAFEQTPQQALISLRLRRACQLLLSEDHTQKEISHLSGFSDVKYFRTAFKRHIGMTPRQYVQSHYL